MQLCAGFLLHANCLLLVLQAKYLLKLAQVLNIGCTSYSGSCRERERVRIESKNPNPKMPLVRYVGGTWRVGGILALSRAFGDAYLKGSGQFEGISAGSDGYSSGFGVVADPTVTLTQLTSKPASV
jgi:hypothetical protein